MPSWELRYIFYTKALLSRRFSQLPVRWDSPYLEPKWLVFWLEKALFWGLAFKNKGPWNLAKKTKQKYLKEDSFYNIILGTPPQCNSSPLKNDGVGRLCSFWDDEFSGAMSNFQGESIRSMSRFWSPKGTLQFFHETHCRMLDRSRLRTRNLWHAWNGGCWDEFSSGYTFVVFILCFCLICIFHLYVEFVILIFWCTHYCIISCVSINVCIHISIYI